MIERMIERTGYVVLVLILGAFCATSLVVNIIIMDMMTKRLAIQDRKIKALCDALHTEYMAPKGY